MSCLYFPISLDVLVSWLVHSSPIAELWTGWLGPAGCKSFVWLAVLNCCWTMDRLAKHGLQQPASCPLSNQADETLQHLLV